MTPFDLAAQAFVDSLSTKTPMSPEQAATYFSRAGLRDALEDACKAYTRPPTPEQLIERPRDTLAGPGGVSRTALEDCVGALQFVLAFYEPGQRYLDGEAWKVVCSGAVAAYTRGALAKAKGGAA